MIIDSDSLRTRGGAWTVVEDDTTISYRVAEGGEHVDINFIGPVEMCLGMSARTLSRCHDLFGQALTELTAANSDPAAG